MTYREALIEQIVRDKYTLTLEPVFHQPSTEFFQERLVIFIDELKKLDEMGTGTPLAS
jgi:hypothetical protein